MIVVQKNHRLADIECVEPSDLGGERLLMRPYCELHGSAAQNIWAEPGAVETHEIAGDEDVVKMVEAGLGIGLLPVQHVMPGLVAPKNSAGRGVRAHRLSLQRRRACPFHGGLDADENPACTRLDGDPDLSLRLLKQELKTIGVLRTTQ